MSPHPHKYKFYCDENFPVNAGKFLKSQGHSVIFSFDVNKPGLTDVAQLAYANKNNFTFLTIDKDFINPNFSFDRIKNSAGIIVIQTDFPTPEQYEQILRKFLTRVTPKQAGGRVYLVSIDKIVLMEPMD